MILENYYTINQNSHSFTPEQREMLLQYSNAFQTFGVTAFEKMEQILKEADVTIRDYPSDIFIDFPNRYNSIGEKTLYNFDKEDCKTVLCTSSLRWFLATLEEKEQIHFSISNGEWHLKLALDYTSSQEKEQLLNTIEHHFLSGKTAHFYLLDILHIFPEKNRRMISFSSTSEKSLEETHLDLTDSYINANSPFPILETSVAKIDDDSSYTRYSLESAFENSVLKSELDLTRILEKLGFSSPYHVYGIENNILSLDSNGFLLQIELWGDLFSINIEDDPVWYTYQISSPGYSIILQLIDPIVMYL